MSIGSVSVDVVPDATGFAEKLKAKLKDVNVKVGVNLDAEKAKASLDRLAMTKRSVTIKADADTTVAKKRLDELARTRTAKVRASVDRSSFSQASSSVSGLTSDLFSMKGAAVTLGPALIPVTAAVVGLAGALAAPSLAAGVGGGIFGAVALGALSKAKKDAKDIADLVKRANAATDPKQAKALQAQADALTKSLPRGERAFLAAKTRISSAFDDLLAKTDKPVFGTLTGGANLLSKVLPKSAPIVTAFGKAVTGVERDLSKVADSKGFTSFVDFLSTKGVSAFKSFVGISGHVALGAVSIVKALTPLGGDVLDNLEKSSAKLDHIGDSKGFQSFLSYVRDVGPKVASTTRDIAKAVGRIVTALAPQGSTMLGIIDGLARTVAKMEPGQIAAVAAAVGALGLATGKFSKLTSLSLLVSAVSYAYKHSDSFHKLADGAIRFADAINSLPSGVKIGLGVTATTAALSRKNVAGSVVSKVLGGGVQKVFVVNMGKGGLGGNDLPGKPGKPGKPPLLAYSPYLLPLLTSGDQGPQKPSKGARSFAAAQAYMAGGLGLNKGGFVTGGQDAALAKLIKSRPDKAFKLISESAKIAGLSVGDYEKQITNGGKQTEKTAAALKHADKQFGGLDKASAGSAAGARRLGAEVFGSGLQIKRTGLSVAEYGRRLHTLPKGVQTKVTTPGAITSKAQVVQLARQYNLTPKQVRTLMQLSGAGKAIAQAREVRATLAAIRDKTATITINRVTNQIVNKRKAQDLVNRADGGWIHGPGTSRSDSIPAMLSNGEFVVNAASARRNAELLQAINGNTRRAASSQNYATGGPVTSTASRGFTLQVQGDVITTDINELARKTAAFTRASLAIASGP